MAPNAAAITTATASSTTLPFKANCLNSFNKLIKSFFCKTLKTTLQNTELCAHVKQIYKLATFYFTLSDLGKFFQIDEG